MIASVSNKQLAIGTWTSAANENTGTIVEFPASNNRPKRTYMYVKFVKGSGSDLYQGTPVGITTEADGAGEIVISADQSAVIGTAFIGVAVSGSTTAVTTAYYGWIQLARPYEVLESVVCISTSGANVGFYWAADGYLSTVTASRLPGAYALSGALSDPGESAISNRARFHLFCLGVPNQAI